MRVIIDKADYEWLVGYFKIRAAGERTMAAAHEKYGRNKRTRDACIGRAKKIEGLIKRLEAGKR